MRARAAAPAADAILFGVVARTARGRERLAGDLAGALPSTFPRATAGWWRAPEGVALHCPRLSRRGRASSALAFAGAPFGDGAPEPDAVDARAAALADALARGQTATLTRPCDFALAAWDGEKLVLARDAMGQRGLFLRADDDLYLFSSELEPLLRDPAFACRLDVAAAIHYLACGLPPPGGTLAERVTRVPAAHLVRLTPGGLPFLERYWSPLRTDTRKIPDDDTRAAVAAALDRAVEERLAPAGDQALLLSGGVDSSYLLSTAAARLGGSRLHAYTIEFTPRYHKNETEYARLVAEAAGAQHHIVPLHAPEALTLLEPTLARAEPCSAWAAITHRRLVGQIAGDGRRHLLSGLGADEIFGGYTHLLDFYNRAREHQLRWRAPAADGFDALLNDRQAGRTVLYPGVARFFSDRSLARAVTRPFRDWHFVTHLEEFYRECRRLKPDTHVFEMMIAHECQRRIPELLLANFEPIGRELGVRTRYPFLAPELIEQVCGLGGAARYWLVGRIWRNKKLLRELAGPRIPALILARLPTSYTAPFADWMSEPVFARPTLARLRRSRIWKLGLLRPDLLPRLERERARGPQRAGRPAPWIEELWALVTLAAWFDCYVERNP